ncbi:AFH_G0001110.mRNA.1.CDS.1 [Saccharomyces cerevisiae]|nr:BMC_2a_G0001150.mRNA.1.CDS.1 [Saccharomyces cerevisiae]CAI4243291.1 BMB_G0001150.mRNA.1.CDS.1 [Saccharomyces cerevisiae]CAI4245349.1 BAP_1a_G0001080.mRNA.1.CDS.1 [Saccharomyces cerevisiae]CAI4247021.1 ALH_1b_G0001080.mRNA.1.CDS.1 [Saccharomyces cerevisiae]CAI4247514.1 ALH_1c_G0001060.mRNA.1.CDS.1 [Saccharomyces cerevisiae]
MTQLKISTVGTGTFARDRHLQSYQELSDKFKVVVAFNRHKTKAPDFAKIAHIPKNKIYDNVDEILKESNVDFIDAAENWLYLPYVKTAKEQIKTISPAIAFTHNFMGPFVTYNKYLAITWRLKPKHISAFLSDGKVHQLVLASTFLVEF